MPDTEDKRLSALYRYRILDTPEEPALDRITEMAARLVHSAVAVIAFADRDRVWFKSHFGLTVSETPRDGSFTAHAILSDGVVVAPDAATDPRFAPGGLSLSGLRIRFCAGAPLITPDGFRIGCLAVMDTRPRAGLSEDERDTLAGLAGLVMRELDAQRELALARAPKTPDAGPEAMFRALMDTASQAIVAVDRRGRIRLVNNKAEELFEYSRDEMIGRELEMLLPEALRAAHTEHRREYFGSPHPRPMGIGLNLSGKRKNGQEFPVEISLNYVDVGGDPLAISFITDISARLRLEAQLRQSQKMEAIGQLAGGIAHDFNNLLTIIQGYASMSLEGMDPADLLREPMQEIERAAVSAAALTRQLLAFSRQQVVRLRPLDLNLVIVNMQKMLRRVIGEDVDLILSTGDDLAPVNADPGLIEQVLMNLTVNARDAMPGGGKLILETANLCLDKEYAGAHLSVKSGPHAMLAVTDTGTGMTEEVRSRIFEPFFTTKGPGRGTGLGLATVYGIVQQMEGSIWVYSEPGKGTTFKILLPAAHGESPATDLGAEQTASGGGEGVLLVEDEDAVRRFVRGMLERQGYRVIEAADTDEALRIAGDPDQRFEVVLTDVIMPRLNGPELAARIQEMRPRCKVLYMSGYTDRAIRMQEWSAGMNFIQKPFTPAALTAKLRDVLAAAAAE